MADPGKSPASRGPYAKGIARRQEILDRAIEVFARRGSDRTSLRAIAQEVGVTHGALTHHFGSLEELLVAVYRESESRGDGGPDLDATPVEVLRLWTESNREVQGLVQLYSSLVASALEEGHPTARAFATERFAASRASLAERVRHNQLSGSIRTDVDPDAVAALVIAASDGLQTQWLLDPAAPKEAALVLLEQLLAPPPRE
ncbi:MULTISPECIES: TetR/AcrR family transcriptional regulator [unclassified Microbacterium]|uniref:TetR/AcrR family transcriptional regulator n=1 Tax=unclassified Microbacterium TaxID=2609290 RepID=UPI0012F75ADE|nr:TetR/AcrR family transcriptional regulator [Microbacterium sp. MAH-37]MVQ43841.1 TetR family transcriptional regulator [Microbacterium sp. MAH-37]